jgi:RHH-type proline utilization regulon transcriptional repressor/proline dehydrogenase/delta 1-pyrroline-5-carboxylate dehydrogenase
MNMPDLGIHGDGLAAAAPDQTAALLAALPDLGDPCAAEGGVIAALRDMTPDAAIRAAAASRARQYVAAVRQAASGWLTAQNLLAAFPLCSAEGVALLRLAEALLRAPDADTQTWLIAEKLAAFRDLRGMPDGPVQHMLTLALRIAGQTSAGADLNAGHSVSSIRGWLSRAALRPVVIDGIRRFGDQFVFAPDLSTAMKRAAQRPSTRELYSFDMLGEGARAAADAQRNFDAYANAIEALSRAAPAAAWTNRDGISVKLSAIHPRFETVQIDRVHAELYPRLLDLATRAARAGINFTIDAEESERLVLQIALLERLMAEPKLAGWEGLGLALQAYMPRALATLDRLIDRSRALDRPLAIRVVKGAYWDAEIKRAQELGLPGFPVFTRKWATDLSYVALARRLLHADAPVYGQFATHNALTVATIVELARDGGRPFEFQRLHGMGTALYDAVLADQPKTRVRVYAPVGAFRELLAYLVRRLLENGANSSFVHQISDASVPIDALLVDPFDAAEAAAVSHDMLPALPTGATLFADRTNSRGIDIQFPPTLLRHLTALSEADPAPKAADGIAIRNPARHEQIVGHVVHATAAQALDAVRAAHTAWPAWCAQPADARCRAIEAAASLLEARHDTLAILLTREAGKTLHDAHLEVREAVDFLRYYARHARQLACDIELPGPAGESNRLSLSGRGTFVCISPWNFPLAIFIGQVAAALVAGNTVVAKPAEQTPLIAREAVRLMHQAGVPQEALHVVCGAGETVGAALASDPRVAGVAFTGSTATARAINRSLAARDAPIGVLIAETGGQNTMLVDSTALPEQVTDAVIASAFRSAGQRCSALRVLMIQDDVAEPMLAMIAGAMHELRIGDPADIRTDVGPLIDAAQLAALTAHRDWLRVNARRIHECTLPPGLAELGHFFAPIAYEIERLDQLCDEHFGPILHVLRFPRDGFEQALDQINASGYGLTAGLHTRLDGRVDRFAQHVRAGNLYVNRNMIGAVVGVQPFGGEGLSGTGPKAGGPNYLLRFMTERTLTINTAAAGGNVELAAGGDA